MNVENINYIGCFCPARDTTGTCAAPLGEVEHMGEPVPEDVVELKEDDWNGPGVCFGGDGGACLDYVFLVGEPEGERGEECGGGVFERGGGEPGGEERGGELGGVTWWRTMR